MESLLQAIIDKPISDILRTELLVDNEPDESNCDICILLRNGSNISLTTDSDGESIAVSNTSLNPLPKYTHEGVCFETRVRSIKSDTPFNKLINETISAIYLIKERLEGGDKFSVIGLKICSTEENYLCYWNCGDSGVLRYSNGPTGSEGWEIEYQSINTQQGSPADH